MKQEIQAEIIKSDMDISPEVSLVIPAFNENGRIEPTLKELFSFFKSNFEGKFEVIIVMDGCNDGTPDCVKNSIKDSFVDVTTIVTPNRLGKGGAIIEALKYVRGDLVAFIDADGAIPAWELLRLIRFCKEYDLVFGSRYAKDSKLLKRRSLERFILSRGFNNLVKFFFHRLRKVNDTQCGVKVFKKTLVKQITSQLFLTDFAFDVNLIYSALHSGLKTKEVGITWIDKEDSKLSSQLSKQTLAMFLSVCRLRLHYSRCRTILNSRLLTSIASTSYLWLKS